ncbi:barstar family protein [Micropruina sp.]|uniref:barstar family protein n=1 Tax=Micropruina sp. TaxID=2737536 RepID=UPI0039E22A98
MTDPAALPWTCLADELGLEGSRMLFADAGRADELLALCRDAGYTVVGVDTETMDDFRAAQAAVASALRLPPSAGRNLDALADSLGDLARYWPHTPRIVLAWTHPEGLVLNDQHGWFRLVEVLADGSDRLWRGAGADPDDRLFETLVFVDGCPT